MAKHEIELALDSASFKRVQEGMDSLFGKKFWRKVSHDSSKVYADQFKSFHKLSKDASETMGAELDSAMSEAVSNYSDDLKDAAAKSAKNYLDATRSVLRKVSKIQERNDVDRLSMIRKIADEEMRALDERIAKGKKESRIAPAPSAPLVPSRHDQRAGDLSNMLSGAAGKMGGGMGAMLGRLAPMVAKLGPILGIITALGVLAKKANEISQSIQSMNKSMLSTRGAADIFATGSYDVQDGINTIRKSFTDSFSAMTRWRMTSEEALNTLNEFSSAGLRIADIQKSLGTSTQDAAMRMVTSARAYGTVLGVQSGTVIDHMANMTKNLGLSFDAAVESLASVDMYAQRSGMSVGMFFSKVQSLNSQLGLMNSSFKAQAKLLSDVSKNSSVGMERAGQVAERLMSAMDFDTGMKILATMDKDTMDKLLQRRLQVAQARMASGDLDEGGRSRLQSYIAELTQALDGLSRGNLLEVGDLLSTGLTDSVTEMSLRMSAVADIFGKSIDTLRLSDLSGGISREQRMLLQQQAGLGSDQEVQQTLMVMQDLLRQYGTFEQAIASLESAELQSNLSEQISEDMRIAKAQLEMTESSTKALTQMRDILYERVYDVLFDIHTFLTKTLAPYLGTEVSLVETAVDQAMRKTSDAIYQAQKEGNTERVKTLKEGLGRLEQERTVVSSFDDKQLKRFIDVQGGPGGLDEALRHRYGYGSGKDALGSVVGPGGDVYRHVSDEMSRAIETQSRVWGEHARGIATEISAQSQLPPQNMIDIMKWSQGQSKGVQSLPMDVLEILYANQKGLIDSQSQSYQRLSDIVSRIEKARIPAMASGGIVDRPTVALIGEAGPEAVVPLSKGGVGDSHVNLNIYGNIYGIDDLKKVMARAMSERDRSRRV